MKFIKMHDLFKINWLYSILSRGFEVHPLTECDLTGCQFCCAHPPLTTEFNERMIKLHYSFTMRKNIILYYNEKCLFD